MPVSVEKFNDEPILIVTMANPIDIKADIPRMAKDIQQVLDAQTEPVWYIGHVHDLSLSFGDFVQALSLSTRGEMAFMRHPMIREFLVIAEGALVQMAAKALSQGQYGGLTVKMCTDREDAISMARAEIAEVHQPA
jgi:hypothetical protein